MKFAFIVTSAVNTKFGVYNTEQRLQQTRDTVNSIRARVTDPKIIILEMSGVPITEQQREELSTMGEILFECSDDPNVAEIYHSTDNWDVVKNSTEVMCFGRAIAELNSTGAFANVDRVFKISGRYKLNDQFDPAAYAAVPDRIVVSRRRDSQFDVRLTQVPYQYMSRLWSWPATITDRIMEVYTEGFVFIAQRIGDGGYCDIEHMLYKFLPPDLVHQFDFVGIEGNIGPNGSPVRD